MKEIDTARKLMALRLIEGANRIKSREDSPIGQVLARSLKELSQLVQHGQLYRFAHKTHREMVKRMSSIVQNKDLRERHKELFQEIADLRQYIAEHQNDPEIWELNKHLIQIGKMPGIIHRRTLNADGKSVPHYELYGELLHADYKQFLSVCRSQDEGDRRAA